MHAYTGPLTLTVRGAWAGRAHFVGASTTGRSTVALWQLVTAVRRHVVIALVGLGLTLMAAIAVYAWPGVYQTRVDVLLLPPSTYAGINPYTYGSARLIATAGVVARVSDPSSSAADASLSESVTLAGQGVTQGFTVRLPNSGSQWVPLFDRPLLDVQAVGRSEQDVRRSEATALSRIRGTLAQLQTQEGVPPNQWIKLDVTPTDPVVVSGGGHRSRSLAAILLLGLALTGTAVTMAKDRPRDDTAPARRVAARPPVLAKAGAS
jgi:hypothetical protein